MNLTKYEIEKKTKKESVEQIEEVLATGDENRKKGLKWTGEVEKAKLKKESDQIAKRFTISAGKRRFDDFTYLKSVREACSDYINTIDYNEYPGWQLKVYITTGEPISIKNRRFATDRGILALLISPKGEYLAKGMRASFDPIIDVRAARGLGIIIEETLDTYTGKIAKKEPEKPKIWTQEIN